MSTRPIRIWGEEAVSELALWAIDALCEPPAEINTYSTRIPASRIRAGREILERAGIDWRELKGTRLSQQQHRRSER